MADLEKTINDLVKIEANMTFYKHPESAKVVMDAIELLKEQNEQLRKSQKDKDQLCCEVSKWKHKFHDSPQKEEKNELIAWILNKQVENDAGIVVPDTLEGFMDLHFNRGISEGLRLVWEHLTMDGGQK